jgi:hypothetical protein
LSGSCFDGRWRSGRSALETGREGLN